MKRNIASLNTFAIITLLALGGCQSHIMRPFSTAAPSGQQHLLVTFVESPAGTALPGGSLRRYPVSRYRAAPLTVNKQIAKIEKDYSLNQERTWLMASINRYCVVFSLAASRDLPAVIAKLKARPDVHTAQAMNEFTAMASSASKPTAEVYNDTHLHLQYGEFVNQLGQLHQISRGETVKIGIIDTLSDNRHPDLAGQIKRQYQYVATNGQAETHGTAIAGIIAAKANNGLGLVGLAPEAELFVYGACGSTSRGRARCNTFNILQGLEQVISDEVEVLNLSIAGPFDPLVAQVLSVAIEKGTVVIAAINAQAPQKSFPASMQQVIGVQALAPSVADKFVAREQFGDWLVRSEKMSTLTGGGYQFFYGSSISTASISSVAALLRSRSTVEETVDFIDALASGDCQGLTLDGRDGLPKLLRQSTTCKGLSAIANN